MCLKKLLKIVPSSVAHRLCFKNEYFNRYYITTVENTDKKLNILKIHNNKHKNMYAHF